jgi:hypothetical protein
MTIKQAVINVCNRMYPGEMLLGYELYERVLVELHCAGNTNKPLQETVARRYREIKDLCGMESSPSVSEYRKKSIILADNEQKQGQRALF